MIMKIFNLLDNNRYPTFYQFQNQASKAVGLENSNSQRKAIFSKDKTLHNRRTV